MEVLLIPVGFFLLIGGIVIFSAGVSIIRHGFKGEVKDSSRPPGATQFGGDNLRVSPSKQR